MQNPRLAARYAKSLLDFAVEQNNLEATLADVTLLDKISTHSRDFASMLRSPIIKSDKKQAILDAVLGNRLSPITKAFFTLLVNKGREANLPEIAKSFIAQYKEVKNIKTLRLTTAVPASDALKKKIMDRALVSLNESQVELIEQVNPDIIGGFVLEVDDKLFDASIRKDLKDVRAQFTQNIYVSQIR
ncbi:MAG: ATP synthase F1 subunit delta [Bacteroidetes bacterium]|nr:ATP synthase F1 subunit delta [Bacteroidota bacterium]MBS1741119.1 ATP synthase F1 subunit delta [Bacteroidota bacterium]MBS1774996.1 ATP synthase F1 subunit delta [Bacteroidota bacterium]